MPIPAMPATRGDILFRSSTTVRHRAAATVGGLAILGSAGAGLATSANAASSSPNATLAAIKFCESGGDYQAKNPASTASGAYQFLTSTWRGLAAAQGYPTAASAPTTVQDAAALELYEQMGTSPWAASSSCWAK